ncbi:MAG: hypothetical protein U0746_12955 [Gemmataceae bacterium]
MTHVYVVSAVEWEEVDDGHFLTVGDGAGVPVQAFANRPAAEAWATQREVERFFQVTGGRLGAMAWTFDDLTHLDHDKFRDIVRSHGVDWPDGRRWSRVIVPPTADAASILRALKVGFFRISEVPFASE